MMNTSKLIIALLLVLGSVRPSHSQPKTDLGRDFWFCIPINSDTSGGYVNTFYIYITSTANTTASIQVGDNPVIEKPLTAYTTATITSLAPANEIPTNIELQTSDTIHKNKAIHIWSNDADLSVSFFSKRSASAEGMYCIPVNGWGKEFIVASYNSLIADIKFGDFPSQFAIIASSDNTLVTIVPTADIRKQGAPSEVSHPKGTPFTVLLNKGECVQYQTIQPATDARDLTGSRVTSDKPIAVEGSSRCSQIPASDFYCDYILEMLTPTRTWGKKYITAPFIGRKYGGDGFLIVGTVPGQVILRNGLQAAALLTKYDFQFIYDVTNASEWTSNAPFMLVQYMLSSTHGAPTTSDHSSGDPAMVVINPVEEFSNQLVFAVPAQLKENYSNYLTIFTPSSHFDSVQIDGVAINTKFASQRFYIGDSSWGALRITFGSGKGLGGHSITSDTTIGGYIYGFPTLDPSDAYAMSAGIGTKTLNESGAVREEHLPLNFGFKADPIRPNPAIGKHNLIASYSLESPAPLRLELFDQLGKSVGMLLSSDLHPEGTFEKQITIPSDLATGTYYYRYVCGSTHVSGKLVIAK